MYIFKIGAFLFFLTILSVVSGNIVLENDHVKYEFGSINGGLMSMVDKASSTEHIHISSANAMIWSLVMGNNGQYLSKYYTVNASPIVIDADGTKRLNMSWAVGNMSVTVKVTLANNTGIAAFRIFVDNNSDKALKDVKFPQLDGFISPGDYDIAWPYDNIGYLFEDVVTSFGSTYPCGFSGIMQFGVMVKNNSTDGIYFAAEDHHAMYKTFGGVPGGYLVVDTLVENASILGSDFNGTFPVKLGVFQGNWIDGCKIYRKFALTAPWASKGKLSQRASTPQKYKDIGLWIRIADNADPSRTVAQNNAILYQTESYFAGIPLGLSQYFWHNNVFDHDLPNYLPAKLGYPEVFADLVSRGWVVEPYINNRVITEGNFAEYQDDLAVNQDGNYYVEFYAENSYVVCPYTAGWQDKIADICSDILDIGANGAYLDQLCATQTPCYSTAHGHSLGGGGHWASGYQNMLDKIKNDAYKNGREIALSGEFTHEAYIGGTDAFLLWQMSLTEHAIPMFPMVYSGYTLMKGSNAPFTWTDPAWRMYVGRLFLWGLQCGWMTPAELFAAPSKAQYLKAIGLYRVMAREYLTYGELVDLFYGDTDITVDWLSSTATLPAVQGALWKSESGNLAILLSNFDSASRTINFTIDTKKYLPDKIRKLNITQTTNRGTSFIRNEQNGICSFSRTLYSGGIEFLEIKPSIMEGDIDGDQRVDLIDLAILSGQWLE